MFYGANGWNKLCLQFYDANGWTNSAYWSNLTQKYRKGLKCKKANRAEADEKSLENSVSRHHMNL